jgi:hypothetical protein
VAPAKPVKPKPPLTLADLPAECRTVVDDGVETASPPAKPPKAAAKPARKADGAD